MPTKTEAKSGTTTDYVEQKASIWNEDARTATQRTINNNGNNHTKRVAHDIKYTNKGQNWRTRTFRKAILGTTQQSTPTYFTDVMEVLADSTGARCLIPSGPRLLP